MTEPKPISSLTGISDETLRAIFEGATKGKRVIVTGEERPGAALQPLAQPGGSRRLPAPQDRPGARRVRALAAPAPFLCAICGDLLEYRLDDGGAARVEARRVLDRLRENLPASDLLSAIDTRPSFERDLCQCERDQEEARRAEEAQYIYREAIRQGEQLRARLRRESGLSGWLARASLSSCPESPDLLGFDPERDSSGSLASVASSLRSWASSFTPGTFPTARGFILQGVASEQGGGYGCGKTHLIAAAGRALLARGIGFRFVTMGDLLESARDDFGRGTAGETIRRAISVPVLGIDDLGAERIAGGERGDFAREQLFRLLDARSVAGRPILATTNLSRRGMEEHIGGEHGGRCLSRLDALADWVAVEGPDSRQL